MTGSSPSKSPLPTIIWMGILFGLLLRLATLGYFLFRSGGRPEAWEYETIAENLLGGRGFAYPKFGTVYQTLVVPAYPVFCASLHWLGGPGFFSYFTAQIILAIAFLLLLRSLAGQTAGEFAAGWAVLLAAINPGLIVYHSYKLDPALLTGVFMLAAVLSYSQSLASPGFVGPFASGILAGLGILTRPDAIAVAALPWGLAILPASRPIRTRQALVFTAAMTVCVAPWLVRNYRIHDRLVLVSASGQHLWAGNNPQSTGTLWNAEGKPIFESLPQSLKQEIWGKDEISQSGTFRAAAMDHIQAAPIAALGRWARNVLYFWTVSPDFSGRTHYQAAPSAAFFAAHLVFPALVLLALAAGFDCSTEMSRITTLIWVIPLSLSLIHAPHYVEGRHRLLALPFVLILAGKGIRRIRDYFHRGDLPASAKIPT